MTNFSSTQRMVYALLISISLVLAHTTFAQTNPHFNITLDMNFTSAEQMLELFERRIVNTETLESLRGNKIAIATSVMIENSWASGIRRFREHIASVQSGIIFDDDTYQLQYGMSHKDELKELLSELRLRNFNQKVSATVEQFFPSDAKIDIRIPMYIVAFGTEKVDAFVRRIIWDNDTPRFVGNTEGELTIVVNLAGAVSLEENLHARFLGLLSTVAHEVFHVAFGSYQDHSKRWKRFRETHSSPVFELLELVQNEGIAYYFSLEQRARGELPRDWNERTRKAFDDLNAAADELLSKTINPSRAYDIIRKANTSGFWNNYGSISGMVMARAIDNILGRDALQKTVAFGVQDFFQKYERARMTDKNLPAVSTLLLNTLEIHNPE
ncbi:MAG: hypothetical protein FJ218_08685 [Ignavibacteria bacterium]|nr:hypothetical protein [Ignavibacteria bacterium]